MTQIRISAGTLTDMFKRVAPAASKEAFIPELYTVGVTVNPYDHAITMFATDRYVLAKYETEVAPDDVILANGVQTVILSVTDVPKLPRTGMVLLTVDSGENHILFDYPDHQTVTVSGATGDYPNLDMLLSAQTGDTAMPPRVRLGAENLAVLAKCAFGKNTSLMFEPTERRMMFRVTIPEVHGWVGAVMAMREPYNE